jgi:hypothetical protein
VASNDPTDTGGLFIGRRPGTAPLKYREPPVTAGPRRQFLDKALSAGILTIETLLCLTVWGPQPAGWLWVGSQVDYKTGNIGFAIVVAFAGMLTTLFMTLAVARRFDHAWKLVRRAAGYEQKRGALEWIFVISLMIVGTLFLVWFFILEGPGPMNFTGQSE